MTEKQLLELGFVPSGRFTRHPVLKTTPQYMVTDALFDAVQDLNTKTKTLGDLTRGYFNNFPIVECHPRFFQAILRHPNIDAPLVKYVLGRNLIRVEKETLLTNPVLPLLLLEDPSLADLIKEKLKP
jgi:hypothetical protein